MQIIIKFLLVALLVTTAFAWTVSRTPVSRLFQRSTKKSDPAFSLRMDFGDMFKKAFANENLPPPKNPGLSRELEPVLIEFLPSKKTIKALPGQKLSVVAQAAGVDIKL
jgi:hypothetical protein